MKREPMPEERAAELAMEKTNALWTAYHKEKDPKERERIKLEIDKAHKEIEIAFEARMQAIRKKATDDLTASLRAAFKTLGGHARKQYGDAVAEDLLAWGNETNVDALAEWLDKTGWAELDKRPEHAAKVEAAFAAAWTAADLLPFSVFNPDTTNAAIIGLASTAFMVQDGKWKIPSEYCLAYPATPRGSEPPPPKETVRRVVESSGLIKPIEKFEAAAAAAMQDQKTILGLDALRVMFKTRDWIHFPRPPKDKTPAADWMLLLAMPWATERAELIKHNRELAAAALSGFQILTRNTIKTESTGSVFVRFPSTLSEAATWGGNLVAVDGDTIFANEPDLSETKAGIADKKNFSQILYPAAWAIAPEYAPRIKGQLLLPGTVEDQRPAARQSFAHTLVDAALLTETPDYCAKLAHLLAAVLPLDGQTEIVGNFEQLVRLFDPDIDKKKRLPEITSLLYMAAVFFKQEHLFEIRPPVKSGAVRSGVVADCGEILHGKIEQLVSMPNLPKDPAAQRQYLKDYRGLFPQLKAELKWNPAINDAMTIAKGKAHFLLANTSRLMELKPDARTFAVANRLYSYWHACKQRGIWIPERNDFLDVDRDLLITANIASAKTAAIVAGVDLSAGDPKRRQVDRVAVNKERERILDRILPELQERGIVKRYEIRRPAVGSRGKWQAKVWPANDWIEASLKLVRVRDERAAAAPRPKRRWKKKKAR